jgi:hypothetical protein
MKLAPSLPLYVTRCMGISQLKAKQPYRIRSASKNIAGRPHDLNIETIYMGLADMQRTK